MEPVILIAISALAAVVILLVKYYSLLKKLKKYKEIEEKGEKILNHGIEREIEKLKEDIAAIKKRIGEEKGILERIKRKFRGG
jgi:peptidoglycan hydrolase CwlO-like protein